MGTNANEAIARGGPNELRNVNSTMSRSEIHEALDKFFSPDGGVVQLSNEWAFKSDPDTSIWRSAANTIGFKAGGVTGVFVNATGLVVGGSNQNQHIRMVALDETTPSDPISTTFVHMYLKDDKIVFQFNDGTLRYKYLDLSGIGVTWVHTTSAP